MFWAAGGKDIHPPLAVVSLLSFHLIWMKKNKRRAARWFSLYSTSLCTALTVGFSTAKMGSLEINVHVWEVKETTGFKFFHNCRSIPSGGEKMMIFCSGDNLDWVSQRYLGSAISRRMSAARLPKSLLLLPNGFFALPANGVWARLLSN